MIDGMIRLATVMKNSALLPASFLRNARPASTESTTVNSHHHRAERRASDGQRRADVDRAQAFGQLVEPVQRDAAHAER